MTTIMNKAMNGKHHDEDQYSAGADVGQYVDQTAPPCCPAGPIFLGVEQPIKKNEEQFYQVTDIKTRKRRRLNDDSVKTLMEKTEQKPAVLYTWEANKKRRRINNEFDGDDKGTNEYNADKTTETPSRNLDGSICFKHQPFSLLSGTRYECSGDMTSCKCKTCKISRKQLTVQVMMEHHWNDEAKVPTDLYSSVELDTELRKTSRYSKEERRRHEATKQRLLPPKGDRFNRTKLRNRNLNANAPDYLFKWKPSLEMVEQGEDDFAVSFDGGDHGNNAGQDGTGVAGMDDDSVKTLVEKTEQKPAVLYVWEAHKKRRRISDDEPKETVDIPGGDNDGFAIPFDGDDDDENMGQDETGVAGTNENEPEAEAEVAELNEEQEVEANDDGQEDHGSGSEVGEVGPVRRSRRIAALNNPAVENNVEPPVTVRRSRRIAALDPVDYKRERVDTFFGTR